MLVWGRFPRGGQGSARNSTKLKDSTKDSLKGSRRDSAEAKDQGVCQGSTWGPSTHGKWTLPSPLWYFVVDRSLNSSDLLLEVWGPNF